MVEEVPRRHRDDAGLRRARTSVLSARGASISRLMAQDLAASSRLRQGSSGPPKLPAKAARPGSLRSWQATDAFFGPAVGVVNHFQSGRSPLVSRKSANMPALRRAPSSVL
jgi:hypothetical protein